MFGQPVNLMSFISFLRLLTLQFLTEGIRTACEQRGNCILNNISFIYNFIKII